MLLTPDQLIALTGYRRPGKQVEALRRMGVRHFVRLDGRPVVDDSALSTKAEPAKTPDWSAING
jgi:hypothetical protein